MGRNRRINYFAKQRKNDLTMNNITTLDTANKNFEKIFSNKLKINQAFSPSLIKEVEIIINNVKKNNDKSIKRYINKFDGYHVNNIKQILVTKTQIRQAYNSISKSELTSIKKSIIRVRAFAKKQLSSSWRINDGQTSLGEKVTPIDRVGIYVPGGKASYPSTVIMNSIPAKVAGVKKIIMTCPINDLAEHSLVIVAADLCGVSKIFRVGGAHAIAALTYGTETIDKVDKIVGPGNIYVTLAKKLVFGEVGIDNIAGPSEIVVIADSSNNPDWIAMDLFSQAEHDELAQPILISTNASVINNVKESMLKLIKNLPRRKIISKSLNKRGMFIKAKSYKEIADIVNRIAPEHLEIASKGYDKVLKMVTNAGAIFLGEYSPEVFGDYCAGPNHVLPTSGSAKFSSPLGVYDFQKRSSIIKISKITANTLSSIATQLANSEGLQAHAQSAIFRKKKK